MKVLTFNIGNGMYAVETKAIQSIIKAVPYSKFPNAEKHILGMFDNRGTVIPLIDIAFLMNEERKPSSNEHYILVDSADDSKSVVKSRVVGLLIDSTGAIEDVEDSDIAELDVPKDGYVTKCLKHKGMPIPLIELNVLFSKLENKVTEEC